MVMWKAPSAEHNRVRAAFAEGLEEEVRAWFAVEGERTVADLLGELGVLEQVRRDLVSHGEPVAPGLQLMREATASRWRIRCSRAMASAPGSAICSQISTLLDRRLLWPGACDSHIGRTAMDARP